MPGHGDFVSRNLPRSFIDPWDGWLEQAVAASKDTLGDGWLDTFLNCPIWRFALASGICGEEGWSGIMMPSVDRVGRYFPLTLASSLPAGTQPFQVLTCADPWFAAIETVALRVLDEDRVDADSLEADVSAVDTQTLASASATPSAIAGGQWGLRLLGGQESGLPATVAHELVRFQVGDYSLWWTTAVEEQPAMALVSPGLPDPAAYSCLLQGTWGASFEADESPADASEARVEDVQQ